MCGISGVPATTGTFTAAARVGVMAATAAAAEGGVVLETTQFSRVYAFTRTLLGGGDVEGSQGTTTTPLPLVSAFAGGVWAVCKRGVSVTGGALAAVVTGLLWYTIERPLATLYLCGPAIRGYGFWEGRPPWEICSALTRVDAGFWRTSDENGKVCDSLVAHKAHAFIVGALTLSLLTLAAYATCLSVLRVCFVNPLLRTLRVADGGGKVCINGKAPLVPPPPPCPDEGKKSSACDVCST